MKRLYSFFLLSFLFVALGTNRAAYGQNQVPNSSFEEINYCPVGISSIALPPTPSSVKDWYKPTTGTSDYYNICARGSVSVPSNSMGWQNARTGTAYSGGYMYFVNGDREYLESPLSSPLIAGHEYLVSFWVSLSDKSQYTTDQVSAYLSTNTIARSNNYAEPLDDLHPQINNTRGRWLSDTADWMEIWGTYTASGGETAILLGNFASYDSQRVKLVVVSGNNAYKAGYYYFDDVCVFDITANSFFSTTKTHLCKGSTATLSGKDKKSHYIWNTGDTTQSLAISDTGTYWVQSFGECEAWVDTFVVSYTAMPDFSLGADTVLCESGILDLHAPVLDSISYKWNDNSTNNIYTVTQSGKYWITVYKEGCFVSDTIQVIINSFKQDLGSDTVLCKGAPFDILLNANVPDGARIKWSTGDNTGSLHVTAPGTYWVSVSDPLCTNSDTMNITTEACECIFIMPNAFSPNNDGVNDVFRPGIEPGCVTRDYILNIYNRYGQKVYTGTAPDQGWDGRQQGRPAEAGTYFYEIRFTGGTKGVKYYQKGDLVLIR